MVDAKLGVFGGAISTKWVVRIVELGSEVTAEHEATAEANGTKGIKTVGVLEDFGFDGKWGDVGGKTVGFDGVVDGLEMLGGVVVFAEEFHGAISGET